MGKKHVVKETEEEILKRSETVEKAIKKQEHKKIKGKVEQGRVYISSSYNNTKISLTDKHGNVLLWSSAGAVGFKGAKKATPYAASKVAGSLMQGIDKLGIEKIEIFVKGVGSGRDSAIRSLIAKGLDVISINDVTPIPHNGCRRRKPRRV